MGDRGNKGTDDRAKPADDSPPHSRVFVVCSKNFREDDLREPFEKFGTIENIHIPRDRCSGESKGVAYIKFSKTSAAAAAIKRYHMKTIGNECRPIKVMIACNRHDNNGANNISEEKLIRLFIKVPKTATEAEVKEHFSELAQVQSVFFQKDKNTQENRGFAYVTFDSFLDAATAYERCDPKYKPMFATPKDELKRSRNMLAEYNNYNDGYSHSGGSFGGPRIQNDGQRVCAMVRPQLPSKYIEALFNIIPGMDNIQYTNDNYLGVSKAIITYRESIHASHAIERLNNFEFPSGEIITVEPEKSPMIQAATNLKSIVDTFKTAVESGNGTGGDLVHLAEAIAQASSFIKVATVGGALESQNNDNSIHCSVKLPPQQPMAETDRCAQRCFIVCRPRPPPLPVMKDVFRRFGDLIDINGFPNKTYMYAKYASVRAAKEAINTLHGATVCGVALKVMEADERQPNDDSKRMKMDMGNA